jgi:nitrite reductase (NADH) small subunit
MTSPAVGRDAWAPVCTCRDLEIGRGVTALVHGHAVALFWMGEDEFYALGSHDPFVRSGMLARGIVGRRGDVPFVGSPTHRQAFDLRTGQCLDDPSVHVSTYQVKVVGGIVHVGPRTEPTSRHDPAMTPP